MQSTSVSQSFSERARELFQLYDEYRAPEFTHRRFTHRDLVQRLAFLAGDSAFNVAEIGRSAEQRPISLYTYGTGPVKVFLWSQMHGDEPTATMALVDIFRFLHSKPEHPLARLLRERLTLLCIPMLNPDGAERFQRRTAYGIDMNRDALALVTPEARLLKATRDAHQPAFGFNLHDQDPRYSVGETTRETVIGLLAPATNVQRTDNDIRIRAKHVAAVFAATLDLFIPGHTAKYDDSFEPRAFGDNIQKWGTSTVLVESGGWNGDPEKMFIRKLNFVGLLTSLGAIADGSYAASNLGTYEGLPFNTKNIHNIVIRNARLRSRQWNGEAQVDIGINIEEAMNGDRTMRRSYRVMDMGDLHLVRGYMELDGRGTVFDESACRVDAPIDPALFENLPVLGAPAKREN